MKRDILYLKQAPRVLVVGDVQQGRYVRLIDRDLDLGSVVGAELRRFQRNLLQHADAVWFEVELIDHLIIHLRLDVLPLGQRLARRGVVQVVGDVALKVSAPCPEQRVGAGVPGPRA